MSDMQRAAVIQTALSSCLNYAMVASVLGEAEEKERLKAAQSLHLAGCFGISGLS